MRKTVAFSQHKMPKGDLAVWRVILDDRHVEVMMQHGSQTANIGWPLTAARDLRDALSAAIELAESQPSR